jgi:hypothetical protein
MFMGVTGLIECPKGIIASSVRLARAKRRVDFFRDILRPSFYLVLKLGSAVSEREGGSSQSFAVGTYRESVSGAIQRTTEVNDGIMNTVGKGINWDRIFDPNFHDLVIRSLRIRLEKSGLIVSTPELAEFPFNVGAVLLCAGNLPS